MEFLIDEGLRIIRDVNDKSDHVYVNKNQCNCLARRFKKIGEALESVKNDKTSSLGESDIERYFLPVLKKGVTLVDSYKDINKALANALARAENQKAFKEIHEELDNLKSKLSWSDDENVTQDDAAESDRNAMIQNLDNLNLSGEPCVDMNNVKTVVLDRLRQDAVPDYDLSYLHIPTSTIVMGSPIKALPAELNKGDKHLDGLALVHTGTWNGCECAIKVFKSSNLQWNMEELQKEYASLVKLRHPHITQLIGCAQAKDEDTDKICLYVLYEKMDGDLRELMKARIKKRSGKPPPFSPTEELSIIRQIALGMFYLHQHGIVHGELKCTNLLVKQVGDNIDVKVSDFHCSRELGSNERYKPTHRARWLPPEAFKYLDPKHPPPHPPTPDELKQGDLYSFAMTCCEVVTGGYPFDGIKGDEVVKGMILKGERPKLPDHLSNSKLKGLIEKCWSAEPEERSTFEEVCYILLNIADLPMPPKASSCFSRLNAPAAGFQPVHDQKDERASQVSKRKREDIVNDWLRIFNVEPVKEFPRCLRVDPFNVELVEGLPHYLKIDPSNLEPLGTLPLGKGSSAEVWAATWIGCKFAVKWLKSDHVSKLRKEVGIMTELLHPHVVRLVGFSVLAEANRCAIVMELMDKSLKDLIEEEEKAKNGPFGEAKAIAIITQLAKGMNFMHSRDKPHGDLKCANVLVRHVQTKKKNYMDVHVKLVDFGLAHVGGLVEKDPTRLGPCQAPEVNLCKSTNEWKAADVYSFGMMCWEIIRGKIYNGSYTSPPQFKPIKVKVSKDLWDLLRECRSKVSKDRPTFPKICERLAAMSPKACFML